MMQLLEPYDIDSYRIIDENTIIAQIKIYNQFSDEFGELIQKYNTTSSICGYTALGNIELFSQYGVEIGYEQLRNISQVRKQMLVTPMKYIHDQRFKYANSNQYLQSHPKEFELYMKDWVANYEISDYLGVHEIPNSFFVRNVAFEYPEEVKKIKYEEKERVEIEKQFIGDNYFVDTGKELIRRKDFERKDGQLYIIDLMGHFLSAVQMKIQEKTVILIFETMDNDRLDNVYIKRFFGY